MEDKEGEEYERNRLWFIQERAYPFGSIPTDARRRAYEAVLDGQRRRATSRASRTAPSAVGQGLYPVWNSIGPAPTQARFSAIGPVSGRIRAVAVSPADPNIILIGSTCGGIWRSTDGGQTFVPVSDDQADLSVGAIAFAPSAPSTVYAAMGQEYLGSGVLKSTDAGRTWRRVSSNSLPTPGLAKDIDVDPGNPDLVYLSQFAGLSDDGSIVKSGFFVSTDGGVRWSQKLPGAAVDTAINAADPKTLYVSIQRANDSDERSPGIYRSQNGGQQWSLLYAGPFRASSTQAFVVGTTAADPNRIYAFASGLVGSVVKNRVSVSTDAGQSWEEHEIEDLPNANAEFIVADPTRPMCVYLGFRTGDLYKSADGGRTWGCLSMGYCDGRFGSGDRMHVDQHALALDPMSPDRIYCGNDGGLYRSTDGGATWASLNASLSLVTFRGVTISPSNPAISYGGTQDNGVQRRTRNSLEWTEFITGDGGPVVFVPSDPSIFFSTYIYGAIYRWRDDLFDESVAGSATFGETGDVRIAFYPPFTGDFSTDRLYFGTWRLFVSDDLGEHWSAPAGFTDLTKGAATRDVLRAIGVSRSNPQVVFTGSAQGRAMVSSNGGLAWKDASAGLPDRTITSITVDRTNPDVAYLTVSGYRTGHVFKTTDRGNSWKNIGDGVPDIPANALLQDPVDANLLYLGTDIGVFRSTNAGQRWEYFNNGLPPAIVLGFGTHPSGIVQLATYGRGAYELGVTDQAPDFTLSFDPPSPSVERGASVTLTAILARMPGFTEEVTVTAPDTKALKLKLKPASGSTTGATIAFKLKAKRSASPGTYTVTFSARSASGIQKSAEVIVTVQ